MTDVPAPTDPNACPKGGQHVWVNEVYLRICRTVQIPGVNPASGSRSGDCGKCGLNRSVRTAYPSGELIVEDRR